ncbi:MAG: GAF domain-containing protein, partial [Nitrospira sp.]|nr:GAF domain-containing protein [Nitrospira sp.]
MGDSTQKSATGQEAWQAQAARLALLSEVVLLIAKTPDLDRLLSGAINKLKWVIDFERCTLALVNSDDTEYQLRTLMETRRDFSKDFLESVPIERGIPGTVIQSGRMRFFPDVTAADNKPPVSDDALEGGSIRSVLSLPLTAYNKVLGAITFGSTHENAFTEDDVKVAQSFAVHLALAIDRWRQSQELEARNNDLTEALEQQTATNEVLHVISSSPTDVQPVLDAIAESSARLCEAVDAIIWLVDRDILRSGAHYGPLAAPEEWTERPVNRNWVTGRAVVDCQTIHVDDCSTAEIEFPEGAAYAKQYGHRATLATPLLREGIAIGAILIRRMEIRPFTPKQIELLKTFADQAVIAIENVRLFQDLTEALEQQTATSEVLQVISSSPTDVQPVFDMIAQSAKQLCHGQFCVVSRFDGELIHLVSHHGVTPEGVEAFQRVFPMRP